MEHDLDILKPDPQKVENLTKTLQCHPILSTLLVNRNITDHDAATAFLLPSLGSLRAPDDVCDIAPAIRRIGDAIENGEKIWYLGITMSMV